MTARPEFGSLMPPCSPCANNWPEDAGAAATTEVLVTVEGHHEGARADVEAALADLQALVREHVRPTSVRAGVVDATSPIFG